MSTQLADQLLPLEEGYDVKLGRDSNGNKVAKLKTAAGSISVQTNGNLEKTHRMDKSDLDKSTALEEIKAYVQEYGTARQKKVVAAS